MTDLLLMIGELRGDVIGQPGAYGTFAVITVNHSKKTVVIIDKASALELLARLSKYCKNDQRFCEQISITENNLSGKNH